MFSWISVADCLNVRSRFAARLETIFAICQSDLAARPALLIRLVHFIRITSQLVRRVANFSFARDFTSQVRFGKFGSVPMADRRCTLSCWAREHRQEKEDA